MTRSIDLNADIGELEGEAGRRLDEAILSVVTSCNIACGGHAGDEESVRKTLALAKAKSVRIGVHPSYPDRENFGRASMDMDPAELLRSLQEQVEWFCAIAKEVDAEVAHLKLHGALYNDAARDQVLADIAAQVTRENGIRNIVGLPDSQIKSAAQNAGLKFLAEGFADRAYEDDGSLRARRLQGAMIEGAEAQAQQAINLAKGQVNTFSGNEIALHVDTICVHGDTLGAANAAAIIRERLGSEGLDVEAG